MVYDGDCGFCTAFVMAASRRLPVPVAIVPWQSAPLERLGIPVEDARRALQWAAADGTRQQGHLAVAAWLRAAGSGWRLLGVVLATPPASQLAAVVYRLVAANRRRIPGPWPRSCSVPSGREPT